MTLADYMFGESGPGKRSDRKYFAVTPEENDNESLEMYDMGVPVGEETTEYNLQNNEFQDRLIEKRPHSSDMGYASRLQSGCSK